MEKGVDPSFFSKMLMESCCRVASRESADLTKPVEILSRALSEVQEVHSKCYGEDKVHAVIHAIHSSLLKVICQYCEQY